MEKKKFILNCQLFRDYGKMKIELRPLGLLKVYFFADVFSFKITLQSL